MKLSRISSRVAATLSCTAVLGATQALNAADEAESSATTVTPPVSTPAAKPIELPETVATVNGDKISREELQKAFDLAVKNSGMDASKLSDDQKLAGYHRFLDDIIIERLLKAKSKGLEATDAEVDAQIAQIKKNFPDEKTFEEQLKKADLTEAKLREQVKNGLAETKWIKSQIDGKDAVSDADAEKFYNENKAQFEQPETVRASHILISTRDAEGKDLSADDVKKKEKEAKAAYDRVKKGEDFAKVADELTEDPSGKGKGGDLNFFPKGAMVPEFDEKAFSMNVGDVSEPVKTQFGYHVIKLTDKKPAGTTPFKEVKEQLVSYLKNSKQQEAVREVIEKLRKDAKITNNLPEMKTPPAAAVAPGAGGTPAPKAE
jgi:peptidyl-prolyl cis-trans isomerase C